MNLIGLGIPTIFILLIIVITDCSFTLKAFLTIIYILKFLVKYDTSKGGHSIHGGKIYKFIENRTSYNKSEFYVGFILLAISLIFSFFAIATKKWSLIFIAALSIFVEILNICQLIKYALEDLLRKTKNKSINKQQSCMRCNYNCDIQCFVEKARSLCLNIDEKAIEDAIKIKMINDGYQKFNIIKLNDTFYYDFNKKVIFYVCVDGNYYHGYDVEYRVYTKQRFFENMAYSSQKANDTFNTIEEQLNNSTVPIFAIVDYLPIDETIKEYEPPIDVGYGFLYM